MTMSNIQLGNMRPGWRGGGGVMRPSSRLAPDLAIALIKKPGRCLSRDEAVDTQVKVPRSTGDLWGQVNDPKMAKMQRHR